MVEFELFAPAGNDGATKRYRLFEQLLAPILVTVITLGADGTDNFMLANFIALDVLKQPLNVLTLMLSVVNAASLDAYLTKIVLELLMSPESTVTPDTPPIEVGKIQLYVVPAALADAVYLYTLELHTLLITVCVTLIGVFTLLVEMVSINVATLSHPEALVPFQVFVPLVE